MISKELFHEVIKRLTEVSHRFEEFWRMVPC